MLMNCSRSSSLLMIMMGVEASIDRRLAAQRLFRWLYEPTIEVLAKLAKAYWLRNAGAASGAHHALVISEHGVSSDGNDGDRAKRWVAANPRCQLKAVLRAQLDVEQNCFGWVSFERREGFVECGGGLYLKIFGLEPVNE